VIVPSSRPRWSNAAATWASAWVSTPSVTNSCVSRMVDIAVSRTLVASVSPQDVRPCRPLGPLPGRTGGGADHPGRKAVVTEVLDGSGAERDNKSGVDVPPDGQRRRRTPCRRMTMRSIR
jgi:hypothetical protein